MADSLGLVTFEIPLPRPAVEVGFAWHPRHDADPAHAWLRGCVRELMNEVSAGQPLRPVSRFSNQWAA